MSLTTEIQRLRTNINNVRQDTSDILEAIANKGVTVPAGSNLDDCAGLVSQIHNTNDNVLLTTLCNNIDSDVDVPIIGSMSETLTPFNYVDLSPGYKINCDSLTASYSGAANVYIVSSDQHNFTGSISFSFSHASTYSTYGMQLGPVMIFMGDPYTQPSLASNAISFVIANINSDVVVHTNSKYERRSNGQLYVQIDSYTQDKIYNVRLTIDENNISAIDIVTGAYFSIDRQYYTGQYSTSFKFGPLSTTKSAGQSASLYSLDVIKL
jgi:hypothetical protein